MNNNVNEIKQIETSILQDLDELDYLLQTLAIWQDKRLSLIECEKKINDLKIKFAIKDSK